jgi:hypothetical protein
MAQFIVARSGAVINLDDVASIIHDADGFSSASGHAKSVTIHLIGGSRVRVTENDPDYQQWIAFMANQPTMEDHLSQMRVEAGVINDIDFEAIMREPIEEDEDDTRTPEEIAAGEPFPREVD